MTVSRRDGLLAEGSETSPASTSPNGGDRGPTGTAPNPTGPDAPRARRPVEPRTVGPDPGGEELFAKGVAIREEMFGPEHGQAKIDRASDFTREFEDMVTRYCFGETWGRKELSRNLRSMITIAMLVALGRPWEIRVHVQGAIANGVSKEQIREILLHSAIYCGVPAAVDGFRNAAEVLDELGVE